MSAYDPERTSLFIRADLASHRRPSGYKATATILAEASDVRLKPHDLFSMKAGVHIEQEELELGIAALFSPVLK